MYDPHVQRRAALDRANAVRHSKRRIKERIAEDPTWRYAVACLTGTATGLDAKHADVLMVSEFLRSIPGIGIVKARAIVRGVIAPESPRPRLRNLSERQRQVIAFRLLQRWGTHNYDVLEQRAATAAETRRRRALKRDGLPEEGIAA